MAYLETEQHTEAARAFDELIELMPDEPMAHANRGLVALREGKLEEAGPHLETAGQLAPDDPDIAIYRSQAAVLQGHDAIARTRLSNFDPLLIVYCENGLSSRS